MNSHAWLVLSLLLGKGALRFVAKDQVVRMVTLIRVTTIAIGATFGGRHILITRGPDHTVFGSSNSGVLTITVQTLALRIREKLVRSSGPQAGISGSTLGGRV